MAIHGKVKDGKIYGSTKYRCLVQSTFADLVQSDLFLRRMHTIQHTYSRPLASSSMVFPGEVVYTNISYMNMVHHDGHVLSIFQYSLYQGWSHATWRLVAPEMERQALLIYSELRYRHMYYKLYYRRSLKRIMACFKGGSSMIEGRSWKLFSPRKS